MPRPLVPSAPRFKNLETRSSDIQARCASEWVGVVLVNSLAGASSLYRVVLMEQRWVTPILESVRHRRKRQCLGLLCLRHPDSRIWATHPRSIRLVDSLLPETSFLAVPRYRTTFAPTSHLWLRLPSRRTLGGARHFRDCRSASNWGVLQELE